MSDDLSYGAVCCYIELHGTHRRHYVTEAPDKAVIVPHTFGHVGAPVMTIKGIITLSVANGVVKYKISDISPQGWLLCEKIYDDLTEYTPPAARTKEYYIDEKEDY